LHSCKNDVSILWVSMQKNYLSLITIVKILPRFLIVCSSKMMAQSIHYNFMYDTLC
jgi:hypothetical protein